MNAFATGLSRNSSLVAFSTAILEQMDEKGLAAVAAHEVTHIANGDMIITYKIHIKRGFSVEKVIKICLLT